MTQDIIDATPTTAVRVNEATPASMLMIAVQRGDDMERLKQLMDLQDRWEANEARKAFNEALAGFKSEAVEVLKRKRVHFTSAKGTTDYKHAELSDVVEAVGPALSRHGFAWNWKVVQGRDWIDVTCVLRHRLGHAEEVTMGGPPDDTGNKNRLQAIQSCTSYLQRYTLKAVSGVAEKGDDTDGRPPAARDEAPAADEKLIDAGRDESMKGMKALTAWWGSLTEPQRRSLTADFKAMRAAAQQVDREAA